ncbi:MAG: peptidoglycan DD-metalloendopeptidase family protein [Gammaproteobacteria bacterium]
MNRVERFSPLLTIGLLFLCTPSHAQSLYKYQDENGVWVYSDRQPSSEQSYEVESLQATLEAPEIVVTQRETSDGLSLIATSSYYGPVQLAYQLSETENIAPDTPNSGRVVLPGRSQTELLRVVRQDTTLRMRFDYRYQHIPGDPAAQHLPTEPYRLPYSAASSYHVSQAYPDFATHQDPSSQYAIDFEMPVGTPIHAARAGVVIDVASDFYQSGTDVEVDGPRANVVRVLHDDGTMSVYAHLNWNSIRVVPGQHIGRGEYIADSGNTGFSTGPHLHFAVQRNADGSIVSVPVEFAGPGDSAVTLQSGDRPTAY